MKLLVAMSALFAFVAILSSPKTITPPTIPNIFASATRTPTPTATPTPTPTPTDTPAPTDAPAATPRPTVRPTARPTPPPVQLVRLSGTAMGTDGRPAIGVSVTIYRSNDGVAVAAGTTNSVGNYSVAVAKNTPYKLFFSGGTVFSRWYVSGTSFDQADIISVGPVDTLGVNMILVKR